MSIRDKINERMNVVVSAVNSGSHLTKPNEVLDSIANVAKFWSALSQEDRDYLNAIRDAIEDELEDKT